MPCSRLDILIHLFPMLTVLCITNRVHSYMHNTTPALYFVYTYTPTVSCVYEPLHCSNVTLLSSNFLISIVLPLK